MLRLLAAAKAMSGAAAIDFRNHRRLAKKRARAIVYTRGKDKKARIGICSGPIPWRIHLGHNDVLSY